MSLIKSRYIIGIDLGTTNSTVSYINIKETGTPSPTIKTYLIPQLVEEATIKSLPSLPSFLYLPGEYELPQESIALPWDPNISYVVGEFARRQGAVVPTHLVSSAKSWLCHNQVDRRAPILPWGRQKLRKRVSPVEASSYYLKHIKDAWNYTVAEGREEERLENQQIIITIPASFDETARELTSEAATMAGYKHFTMLEEPQAAFYCWISSNERDWKNKLQENAVVLVIDIGGGTTDLNLIILRRKGEKLYFERVAVGEHLILGGDNMDLALAREVEMRLVGDEKRLDFRRWLSLSHQCRVAKEELLSGSRDRFELSIAGAGRRVIGGFLKTEITLEDIKRVILDGFFKSVDITEPIKRDKAIGFQEIGLPYVTETNVFKHLAWFLRRHAQNPLLSNAVVSMRGENFVRPDVVLFNGGVFRASVIRKKVLDVLNTWFGDDKRISVIENKSFDHAVSIGAAYYGWVKRGRGVRISGGSGRAYYIGVKGLNKEDEDKLSVLCIVPKGLEEGEEVRIEKPQLQVMTNRPVSFPLYTSSYRIGDRAGDVIVADKESLRELPPVKTVLKFGKKSGSITLPVNLHAKLTEFGTLDIWLESKESPHKWKLAFQLRMEEEEQIAGMYTIESSLIKEACELIERVFIASNGGKDVTLDNLLKKISELFHMDKNNIPIDVIRKMWDTLLKLEYRRGATPKHESRWLNLSGFFLRPGFGYPLDEWRIKELWKIFHKGIISKRDIQCRIQWWIMWRRVAGGLNRGQQEHIFNKIAPWLLKSRKRKGLPKLSHAELIEMWMLAASLEHLPVEVKIELGEEVLRRIKQPKDKDTRRYYWMLSRIGARIPFYGPVDRIVPKDVVQTWIEQLIKMEWSSPRDVAYCITQMSRKTGDMVRDIDDKLSALIVEKLSEYEWSRDFIRQIKEVIPIGKKEEKQIFGESLPVGLYVDREQKQ